MTKFKAALDNHTFKAVVDKDLAEARDLGVQGTPTSSSRSPAARGCALRAVQERHG